LINTLGHTHLIYGTTGRCSQTKSQVVFKVLLKTLENVPLLTLVSSAADTLLQKLVPESGYIRSALELSAPVTNNRGADDLKRKLEPEDGTSTASQVEKSDTILKEEKESRPRKKLSRPLTLEEREEALLPELKPLAGTELRLTKFPDCNYPAGSTPAEITFHSMDLSYALETMLKRHDR